jgi:ribonuclease/clavin/mitogillin
VLGQVSFLLQFHGCDLISEYQMLTLVQNPSKFTLQGTNTYLIGDQLPFILFDAGDAVDAYIPLLESALRDAAQRTGVSASPRGVHPLVSDIIISHRHHDHHAGLPSVLSLLHTLATEVLQSVQKGSSFVGTTGDRYSPPRIHKFPSGIGRKLSLFSAEAEGATFESTLEVISRFSPELFEHVSSDDTAGVATTPPRPLVHDLTDKQILTTRSSAPIELKVLHTPGHTTDSISLLLPSEGAMFSADTVLGEGTAVFEDLAAYMSSLGRMLEQGRQMLSSLPVLDKADDEGVAGKIRIYPGHGPVLEDGLKALETYISHRAEREAQILSLLPTISEVRDSSSDKNSMTSNVDPATIGSIVRTIYAKYPPAVWPAAERGIWLHLEKLESEGKAVRIPSAATEANTPSEAEGVEAILRNTLDGSWARTNQV